MRKKKTHIFDFGTECQSTEVASRFGSLAKAFIMPKADSQVPLPPAERCVGHLGERQRKLGERSCLPLPGRSLPSAACTWPRSPGLWRFVNETAPPPHPVFTGLDVVLLSEMLVRCVLCFSTPVAVALGSCLSSVCLTAVQ